MTLFLLNAQSYFGSSASCYNVPFLNQPNMTISYHVIDLIPCGANFVFPPMCMGSCGPVLALELGCHAIELSLRLMSFVF
jgi:hypothetical protein